ncbi:MAG: hypothetical protein M3O30_10730 [Planctomycetota bacterium]|nr:hypothetical protein [Planctomycetota bacterium]
MRRVNLKSISLVASYAFLGFWTASAHASFHLWKVDEVFSNASGSVQYIEFQQPNFEFDDERFLTSGGTVTDSTLSHTLNFLTDLPSAPNANSHFLVATPGYVALKGVPAPDYVLPSNNFFSTSADTIIYAGGVNSLAFTAGQLPVDGVLSLNRAYGSSTFTTATNSPTNFAGQTGTVSLPEPGVFAIAAGSALIGLIRPRRRRAS